jgi:hypothetical protein
MDDTFTIRFERYGGFTGMTVNKIIDSLQLEKEERELVWQLINGSGFFSLPAEKKGKPQPDRFNYKITIQTAGKKHIVECSQTSVPDSLKELIRYLVEKSRLRK